MRVTRWLCSASVWSWATSALVDEGLQTQSPLNQAANWRSLGRAPLGTVLELHIALSSPERDGYVSKVAQNIADPLHPDFRRHLSSREAADLINPGQPAIDAVQAWLKDHSLAGEFQGNSITVRATVRQANILLNTAYDTYGYNDLKTIRTSSYHLPPSVSPYIGLITPTTQFPFTPRRVSRTHLERQLLPLSSFLPTDTSCTNTSYTSPACLRQIYNITHIPSPNRTTFAIYGTEAASFSARDLQTYLSRFRPEAAGATYSVIGSGDPSNGPPGIASTFETALDTQTALGLAWPAKALLYNVGGVFGPAKGVTYDPFVKFLNGLIHNETVPGVVSFSESMPEDMLDPAYARSVCQLMALVGARGVSLMFSSGDNGPNGDQPTGRHDNIMEVEFPASCPWVTGVGGTTGLAGEVGATTETVIGAGLLGYTSSGGGFSNLFARPAWQEAAAGGYVRSRVPRSYAGVSGFNGSGRGVPDVAAFSTNVPAVVDYVAVGVGGTSASAPIWAAVVATLNDHEQGRGRAKLGFLNPWLYGLGAGRLKDITGGGDSRGGCYALLGCRLERTLGYNVTAGWDPVTGLGSPVVGRLIEQLERDAAKRAEVPR